MIPKTTFDTYKSFNLCLHNKLTQQDEYSAYLSRIQSIVNKRHPQDRSSQFYIKFLNKSREKSNHQKSLEKGYLIRLQNKHLLDKIQKENNRKLQKNNTLHQVHLYEKRLRDQQKINDQNCKLVQRIINQDSYLVNKKIINSESVIISPGNSITPKRMIDLQFFDLRIKTRKLPKLIKSPSMVEMSSIR